MWKIYYCPPSGENNSPYEEIIGFGNPIAARVFNQLELNAVYDSTTEWIGSVKQIKYKKEKWLQWTWGQVRVHFLQFNDTKTIIILNAFLKKSDKTKNINLERTYKNLSKLDRYDLD
ncbi:MAG: hypothetical protein K0B14_17095 [Anaerolineaceae bacterium]|nr:hypothetical protein [Anaerolineaceae bacterium]